MSFYIKKYPDQLAYSADAAGRPADQSSVSLIGTRGQFDGINVITDTRNPLPGDAVWFDKLKNRRVLVRRGTLVKSLMDTDRYLDGEETYIGSIYGRHVRVLNAQLPGEMYAAGDEWLLDGFDMSAAGSAEVTFKYYSAAAAYTTTVTLSWQAGDDISVVVAQVAAVNTTYVKNAVKVSDSSIGVVINGYNTGMGVTVNSGSITATRTHQGYQARYYGDVYTSQILRQNGELGTTGYVQPEIYLEYVTNSGADTTNQSLTDGTVKKSRFNETDNPELYEMFKGDYAAYVAARFDILKAEYPCARGFLGEKRFWFGDEETEKLGTISHENVLGNTAYDFPILHSALLRGKTLEGYETGFEPGNAHLGGSAEAYLLYTQILKSRQDPINKTIVAAGGTAVAYNFSTRLAFQSSSGTAWIFSGTSGTLYYGNYRINANAARLFRASKFNEF